MFPSNMIRGNDYRNIRKSQRVTSKLIASHHEHAKHNHKFHKESVK